ncbi:hypothetical protein DL771_008078 [Monosporascus sp. 5C6A]|nr:hypothetical protein DL771_008078 [Monosporascus sp. 5C6A]
MPSAASGCTGRRPAPKLGCASAGTLPDGSPRCGCRRRQAKLETGAEESLIIKKEYGEGQLDDKKNNLRGTPFRVSDQSGVSTNAVYDNHGNCIVRKTRFASAYSELLDWSVPDAPAGGLAPEIQVERERRCVSKAGKETSNNPWTTYIADATYTAAMQPERINYGNGSTKSYVYDEATLAVVRQTTARRPKALLRDTRTSTSQRRRGLVNDYTYDACGQLTEAMGCEQFDAATDRLNPYGPTYSKQRTLPGDGKQLCGYVETTSYDVAGNITRIRHGSSTDSKVSGWTRTYAYRDASKQPPQRHDGRQCRGAVRLRCRGCVVGLPGVDRLEWDFASRLRAVVARAETSVVGSEKTCSRRRFAYELSRQYFATGQTRIRKATVKVTGGGGTEAPRALVEGERRASRGTVTLVRFQVDGGGGVLSFEEYAPYGATTYRAVGADVEAPSKYRFAWCCRDYSTGLYHCGMRYYTPWLGRWMAPDPLGVADGLNLYAYAATTRSGGGGGRARGGGGGGGDGSGGEVGGSQAGAAAAVTSLGVRWFQTDDPGDRRAKLHIWASIVELHHDPRPEALYDLALQAWRGMEHDFGNWVEVKRVGNQNSVSLPYEEVKKGQGCRHPQGRLTAQRHDRLLYPRAGPADSPLRLVAVGPNGFMDPCILKPDEPPLDFGCGEFIQRLGIRAITRADIGTERMTEAEVLQLVSGFPKDRLEPGVLDEQFPLS